MTKVKATNIDQQITAYIGNEPGLFSFSQTREKRSELPKGNLEIKNDKLRNLFIAYVQERLDLDKGIELWEFNFIQDVIDRTTDMELKNGLIKILQDCKYYDQNRHPDLVKYMRPSVLNKVGLNVSSIMIVLN